MDLLEYAYGNNLTNRLDSVTEQLPVSNSVNGLHNDITGVHRYIYDQIGNLTSDLDGTTQGIETIEWNVFGKISKVKHVTGSPLPDLEFTYDASGQRVMKKRIYRNPYDVITDYYVRDAQGNIMSIYSYDYNPGTTGKEFTVVEQPIYGSSRLGTLSTGAKIYLNIPEDRTMTASAPVYNRVIGQKNYELTDHLGNVRVVFTDYLTTTNFTLFNAKLRTVNDYYAFGMQMPGRGYNGENYRWGYNGKEMDNEWQGTGNIYDYGFRIYDPRLGRFLSIDPLFKTYPWYTPYQYAGNSPIAFIDLDGLERVLAITFNGDVNYRADMLERINADDISKKTLNTDPGTQLAQAFIDASNADENGVGFVAIWGHGTSNSQWGTATNTNMGIDDLGALRTAIRNGDVSFTDNAIIYIGNCNAGTCNSDGQSFAQELANITGVRVVAGEGSVGMSKTQVAEEREKMEYSMYNTKTQNFKMFREGQEPVELGGTISVPSLMERGKLLPIEPLKPREIQSIPTNRPESTIIDPR